MPCGFAGIVRFDDRPIDPARLDAMRAHLAHRGPDGRGTAVLGPCGLTHTRLSIIDLLSGAQPMHVDACDPPAAAATADDPARRGPLSLVFNGEVYNHRELRRKLEALGHQFHSDHSDTEVILFGYRQWGTELPKLLHGMFAFAIWDAAQRRLMLCRDRAGKKPLYFHRGPREIVFASLVATLAIDLRRRGVLEVCPDAMRTFLRLGYTFGASLIHGVHELPAAHWMTIEHHGTTRSERYWRPPPISRSSTSIGAAAAVREVLVEAVGKRLEADVPLGVFLSGGIDSSVIAALAQNELRQRGLPPLRTFSVAMPDLDYDESAHAQQVADHVGARHTVLVAEPHADLFDDMARLIAVSGEPFADSSILPTYWLSRTTRRHVKVALSGDGGDELFGGYDRYRAMRILARHRWWVRALPLAPLRDHRPRGARHRLSRLVHAARIDHEPARYAAMIHLFDDQACADLGLPTDPRQIPLPDWPDEPDPAHAAMRWDFLHYLPFDLLRKVDRASMAVALEVRCPFLDTAVCDLAGHLPTGVLMPDGRAKGLLRQVAAQWLPRGIIARRKRGFAVPIGQWFAGPLRGPLSDLLLAGDLASIALHDAPIPRLLDDHLSRRADHTHRLFALAELALWARWLRNPTVPEVVTG